ncbi:Protein OBERON like [Actinidia chinensis var. chinensis]|uniref:Protein OBERON like n=1 Tax=Actinidia chinensis var. chinensis TaxID=1590841 RepID=A0A2R6QKS7_ACTCC|nr:Protein OBERON like [Actinidia chinensis var. chinensis]
MKKLRSSDDLNSFGEKGVFKDWGRRDEESSLSRSSSHRNFYYKSDNGRKGLSSSSSRYDRLDDERESSRLIRKWSDYDSESYDRRMSYDRYRDGSDRGILSSSPRGGYGGDRIHRSDSFSGSRREFPKGFRSERDRSRRTDSVSSWRRFGIGKDVDEDTRPGGDSVRVSKVVLEDRGYLRSPQGLKEAKSPPWSRDSGSEQSKSVEVKKNEDIPVESDSSSEMEEGELEPEPEPAHENEPVVEDKAPVWLNTCQNELEIGHQADNETVEDGAKSWSEVELNKDSVCEKKLQVRPQETAKDLVKEVEESSNSRSNSVQGRHCNEDVTETIADNADSKKEERERENSSCDVEGSKETIVEKSMPSKEEGKEDKGIDLEAKVGDIVLPESIKESSEGSGIPKTILSAPVVGITQNIKDKGKSVAVSPSSVSDSAVEAKVDGESDFLLTCRDVDTEGPSIRGLELFSRDPVKQQQKPDLSALHKSKDEKLVLEPLDLSLSLPNVLLPINSHNMVQAPGSPVHAKSTSTFHTNSDGFTASMSFSGSQQFTHNPSCSLTHNSFNNYEQSVGSRPLFQGVDQVSPATWHGQSSNEQKHKEGTKSPVISGSDSFRSGTTPDLLGKELSNRNQEGTSAIAAGSSQEPMWFKALYSEKAPQLDRASSLLPSFNSDENNKRTIDSYLQRSAEKEPAFNELDSIVRIKQEEAKMFQSRADEARRDAESLKRIAAAKNEKIEEEYTSRIAKLRLPEAEDIRKRKVDERLALERSYADFLNTKARMDADIKDLMSKMEATRQNFLTNPEDIG